MSEGILIGGGVADQVFLHPRCAHRHHLVCGATGTGKAGGKLFRDVPGSLLK